MLAMGRVGLTVLPLQCCDDPKEIADREVDLVEPVKVEELIHLGWRCTVQRTDSRTYFVKAIRDGLRCVGDHSAQSNGESFMRLLVAMIVGLTVSGRQLAG